MAGRTRKAAAQPAPEPEVEETDEVSRKRGPGALAEAHVAWIAKEYGVEIDPEHLYLAQTTRRAFRDSEEYEAYLESEETRKEEAAQAKANRKADRDKAKEEAAEEPAEETPAPKRRGRKAAAPAQAEAPAEEQAAPATRRRRSAKATAEAAPAEETTEAKPTTARRGRKAPF